MNFTLEVGAVQETVEVTAEAPLVNTTSGSLGGLVDEQRMADLPLNGRNYLDLTLLQPGVNVQRSHSIDNGVWFSSNGAPIRSNSFLLDGASMVGFTGTTSASVAGTTLGVEGIQEYRVVTSSFSSEYGMSMGSQMLIVSKSGTNNFHGSLFEYLRNSALDARNFFDRQTVASNRRLPPFARNNFGGSLGGPLHKDKTFFHVVFEGVRERLGVTTISSVIPSQAKVDGGLVPQIAPVMKPLLTLFSDPNLPNNQFTFPFSQPTDENYGQLRVDHMVSNNDNLFVRHTIDDTTQTKSRGYPQFKDTYASRLQFGTVSESHIFSPTLLNTFRFSYSRSPLLADSSSGIIGPQFSYVPGQEIGWTAIGGVTPFQPDVNSPYNFKQNIFTWSDDLYRAQGRHSWKFGTLINRYQQYVLYSNFIRGRINFANISEFLLGQPTFYQALTPGSIVDRTYHYTTLGFYVQDDVRVKSNLTFNLGLRYEFMTQPQEVRGRGSALRDIQHDAAFTLGPPFENPSMRNISPRFGFAWDLRGDGKTALRGGFGLLYDLGNMGSSFLMGVSGSPPFSSQSLVQYVGTPPTVTLPFSFPTAGKDLRGPDYHLQQPHMLSYNLTVERELPFAIAFRLAYGGSRGINLVKQTEGNPTVPQVLPDGRPFWTGNESRTNPNWETFSYQTGGSNSWYNSLQFVLTKRLSKGLQFESAYTWSKLIDEAQGQTPGDAQSTQAGSQISDPSRRAVDRGLGISDVPHNWRFNAIYRLPGASLEGVAGKVFSGWWASGILSVQNGPPFSPTLTSNRSRSNTKNTTDRPDLLPGRKANTILGDPNRWYDPSVFSVPPAGFLGTAGRNILRRPGLANLDLTLAKDTRLPFLGENGKLVFRAEIFNILNRANFGVPNVTVLAGVRDVEAPLANAGRISNTDTTSRQIQLALKILF
ncbi:MAG: hypothetical protein A3J28_16670 [Acidobacteria bacterium RIFCSPLOWO2_12_FULL_60_22]|nr:MAG: hypothetical protein A3J28_16670 [Acidobacteria bacterium RIFCSPLOWO2_12_FULL_60_22]